MTPAGEPEKSRNYTGLHIYATTFDSQTGINRPPAIPAVEIPQTRFPTRIAGRCGPAGGAFRPPAFILLHFRPHVSPPFYRVNRPLGWAMELVKCSGFVYEILTLLAWMTHTSLRNSAFSNTPQKRPKQGLVWERGCFLTPAAKTAHRPIQAGLRGLSGFAAYWSSGFLLFLGPSPKSFSLFMRRSFYTGGSILRSP